MFQSFWVCNILKYNFICRHSSIFLTDDEKEGKVGGDDDDMPDLPDNIDSFQDEDMEDAITKKKDEAEEETASTGKDEL